MLCWTSSAVSHSTPHIICLQDASQMPVESAVFPPVQHALSVLTETFFNVEKEFSQVAVDTPNVNPSFNAIITVGLAVRGPEFVSKMLCVVHFYFPDRAISVCRNWHLTVNSASTKSSSGFTFSTSIKVSFSGCKAHRASTSWLFCSLNLADISPSTSSRVLKNSILHCLSLFSSCWHIVVSTTYSFRLLLTTLYRLLGVGDVLVIVFLP